MAREDIDRANVVRAIAGIEGVLSVRAIPAAT